jgi:hypothetical protein
LFISIVFMYSWIEAWSLQIKQPVTLLTKSTHPTIFSVFTIFWLWFLYCFKASYVL